MITLKGKDKIPNPVPLHKLENGVFFEFLDKIYQVLFYNGDEQCYSCLELPGMNYIDFEYNKLVRPVDVEITVTGYTKE